MLTYESLIDQAKLRGMPAGKIRGVLREYLQILILKEIYRTKEGKKLYFTGGTCLRLVENLKRFSEDLDFDTNSLSEKDFVNLMEKVKTELERIGLCPSLKNSSWDRVYSFKFLFPDIEKKYSVSSRYSKKQGIIIKIEANKSKYKIKGEPKMISGFGEFYPVICTNKGVVFANKIDALIQKERARHIYDFMFMLSNKYPVDKKLLSKFGIKGNVFEYVLKKINSYSKLELKKMAESFRPFLFDESEADKVANAHQIILLLMQKYKDSKPLK